MHRVRVVAASCALAAGATLLYASPAAAEWTTLPNGELGYAFTYSTTGTFTCSTGNIAIGTCVTTGSTVVLDRDGATMTLSFAGASNALIASTMAQPASLGTLTVTIGGTQPFAPPEMFSSVAILTRLNVALATDIAGSPVHGFCRPFSPRAAGLAPYGMEYGCSDHIVYTIERAPAPYTYGQLVFDHIPFDNIRYEDATYEFTSTVGVIPEPTTVALTATGLLLVMGAASRRRHRR